MCGRYRLSRRKQLVEEYFDTSPWDDDWSPRYNVAPTQAVPVIRQHPKEPVRQISPMRWGLSHHNLTSIASGLDRSSLEDHGLDNTSGFHRLLCPPRCSSLPVSLHPG